jgi:hypothetical protein
MNPKQTSRHTRKSIRTAAALAAALLIQMTPSAQALDPWTNVVDFTYPSGPSAAGVDVGTDTDGNIIYNVGDAAYKVGGYNTAVVLASADHGTTWGTLNEYADPNWSFAANTSFAADPDGGLYLGGELYDSSGPYSAWIVRESHDLGATWTMADTYQPADAPYSWCSGVAVSPARDLYAIGMTTAVGTNNGVRVGVNPSWVVRRRALGAPAFETVDKVTPPAAGTPEARSIAFATAGVFVAGHNQGIYGHEWLVRRSTDGVQNWTAVDSLTTPDGLTGWWSSAAEAVAVDGTGAIYVAGSGLYRASRHGAPTAFWLVRRSADGGATWTTVDSFIYASGTTGFANGIFVDPSGTIFVSGGVTTSQGDRWLVRKGTPGTTAVKQGKTVVQVFSVSWTTSDDYQAEAGQSARARKIVRDASGNLFVTGWAATGGVNHWLTRKLPAP